MKKKVAIITIFDEANYGNRLQNCAVQYCLEKWGYRTETIVKYKNPFKYRLKRFIRGILRSFAKKYLRTKHIRLYRKSNFENFTNKYTSTRFVKTQTGDFNEKIAKKYDFFVVGSDQVWNPAFSDLPNNMLLTFAPTKKRYCFSPSFGISELDEKWKPVFSNALRDFQNLCAREEEGVKIIKELTGREDVYLTIDPTLMLDADDWLKYSEKVDNIPSNYVFDYFLSEKPLSDGTYIAQGEGKQRIDILESASNPLYFCGPSEFIYLVANADVICTDSFHACVFSILFSKPFVVYRRNYRVDMFSRIETLLALFGKDASVCVGQKTVIDPDLRDKVLSEKRRELEKIFSDI